MKVAVLGCSGAMGAYFTEYFVRQGHSVTGYDRRKIAQAVRKFTLAKSNRNAVEGVDVVVVAVPMRETAKVIREVLPSIKDGALVLEIASLKTRVLRDLRRFRRRNVTILSVHPLFGPDARSKHPKICVIGGERQVSAARRLFPGAKLIPLDAKAHDRLMAYALSLVHLANLAFVSAIAGGIGLRKFEEVSTPTGSEQLKLSRAVLAQSPTLFSRLQVDNPFAPDVIHTLVKELRTLERMVGRGEAAGIERRFLRESKRFEKAELDRALRRVYSASKS